jgi:hypothetical protein
VAGHSRRADPHPKYCTENNSRSLAGVRAVNNAIMALPVPTALTGVNFLVVRQKF